MKRIFALILGITLVFCLFGCSGKTNEETKTTATDASFTDATPTDATSTDGDSIEAYVTVAADGLNLAYQQITVSDSDSDGKLTVNDAIYSAHEQYYAGGAASGYKAEKTEYGISLYKLWGVENGGSYGYYLNDSSAMSLYDEIKNGDSVYVFAYTDTEGFSDSYSYFDKKSVEVKSGEAFELTLSAASFDENWSPVTSTVAGAYITANGEKLNYKTDENGKVTLMLSEGIYTLSAVSDTAVITPAVCLLTVTE